MISDRLDGITNQFFFLTSAQDVQVTCTENCISLRGHTCTRFTLIFALLPEFPACYNAPSVAGNTDYHAFSWGSLLANGERCEPYFFACLCCNEQQTVSVIGHD